MSSIKKWLLWCLLGVGMLVVSLYCVFHRDDCEIVSYTDDLRERIGDRQLVVVLEDSALFDRKAAQKLMLPLFSDENTFSVTFCDGSVARNLAKLNLSLVYCFGAHSQEIGALDREPSYLYVIFPNGPPPQKHFSFTTAVVLPPAGTKETYNDQWKQWCIEQNAPYFETEAVTIKAAQKGIQIVNEMLVTARKKQSTIDYQKHLQIQKN